MLKEFQKLQLKAQAKTLQILETFYKDYQQQVRQNSQDLENGHPNTVGIQILETYKNTVSIWIPDSFQY